MWHFELIEGGRRTATYKKVRTHAELEKPMLEKSKNKLFLSLEKEKFRDKLSCKHLLYSIF